MHRIAIDEHLFPTDPAWGDRFQWANYVFYDDPLPLEAEPSAWLGPTLNAVLHAPTT